jgi:hypothetical protein
VSLPKKSASRTTSSGLREYNWALHDLPVLQRNDGTSTQYFVRSSQMRTPITSKLLASFRRRAGRWSNFNDYKTWRSEVWEVRIEAEVLTCTCPTFAKHRLCKHALGMKIRRKEVQVPPEAKNVPLGQKRKRGRPSKAKKALLLQ